MTGGLALPGPDQERVDRVIDAFIEESNPSKIARRLRMTVEEVRAILADDATAARALERKRSAKSVWFHARVLDYLQEVIETGPAAQKMAAIRFLFESLGMKPPAAPVPDTEDDADEEPEEAPPEEVSWDFDGQIAGG